MVTEQGFSEAMIHSQYNPSHSLCPWMYPVILHAYKYQYIPSTAGEKILLMPLTAEDSTSIIGFSLPMATQSESIIV